MSHGKLRLALTILALVASSRTAPAQNLLTNPDFDSPAGLDGWTTHNGSTVLGADSGSCATSGVGDGLSAISGGNEYFWMGSQQCILVDPMVHPELFVAAMYRTTGSVFARIYLQRFSDTDCATGIGFTGMVAGSTSPDWTRIAGSLAIASDTVAVQLMADNNVAVGGAPQFTVQWDRFYLGLTPEIFVDDFEFEGGSACHWLPVVE